MKGVALFAAIWLTFGFFAWGIDLREERYENSAYAYLDCRHDQSFSLFWGELGGPVSLIVALEESGFAEHGMQWTCEAGVTEGKDKP